MEIKKGQIVYPEVPEEIITPEQDYELLKSKPSFIAQTSTSVDLSASSITLICLHTELEAELVRAFAFYTEGSSADAGVTIQIGKESDVDYYFTGTSEASKSTYYTKELTLLKKDITKGDTVTFTSVGGKSGAGTIMLVIEYKLKGVYRGE